MNDTPTPRTDEAEFSFDTFNGVDPWEGKRWIKVVPSKISAKLESELTAVTEQRDRLIEAIKEHKATMQHRQEFHDSKLYEALQSLTTNKL